MRHYLRKWITLAEAATHFGDSFWYNPKDGKIIPASDHGQAVMDDPDAFGIDYRTQEQMDLAFPEGEDDDYLGNEDDNPRPEGDPGAVPAELWGGREGWHRNDAWEVLAMNRGWVRVGSGTSIHAAYVSSSKADAVWKAVNFLAQTDNLKEVEIEIARPRDQVFKIISGNDLQEFLDNGPRKANAFLLNH